MFICKKRLTALRILTLIVLILPANAVPESVDTLGYIEGTVTDSEDCPLLGATVIVVGTRLGAMTTNKGYFIIEVEPGIYSLEAIMVGMSDSYVDSVAVHSRDTTLVHFVLEPATGAGDHIY